MPGTFTIVTKKTGEGGVKHGPEVKRVQQLLHLAGYTSVGIPDGGWGKKTTEAWQQYQADYGFFPTRPFVQGYDPDGKLLPLAEAAGVLVPLPGGDVGAKAVRTFFDTAQTTKLPYGWADHGNGSMLTWGSR